MSLSLSLSLASLDSATLPNVIIVFLVELQRIIPSFQNTFQFFLNENNIFTYFGWSGSILSTE